MDLDFLNISADNTSSTNKTNQNYQNCDATNYTFLEFISCIRILMSQSLLTNFFYFIFSMSTAALNLTVILLINRHRKNKTVFDKIFIGHAFVDFLVGIFVIPLFCIYTLFGYWPLGKILCHFYISLDYTICHVGILHMMFLSYARLRSVISPKNFEYEFLISNAKMTIFGLWIVSAILWIPSVNLITSLNYQSRECMFTFDPIFIILQDLIAYIMPILVILGITMYIVKLIQHTKKQQFTMVRIKNLIQMSKASNCNRSNQNYPKEKIDENESLVVSNFQVSRSGTSNLISSFDEEVDTKFEQIPSKLCLPTINISPYAKLYVILGSFCTLWLPFCILWPVKSVSPDLIDPIVYTTTYWMGYAQSFINPILLLILNKNYRLQTR